MQNRVCARTSRVGSSSRWMTGHHALSLFLSLSLYLSRRIKISEPPPANPLPRRFCPLTSSRRPSAALALNQSATHQPSGYLKSLSVDRLRYRRCFVRELVAFVARLHDPSLSSLEYIPWSSSEKRGRKIEREICTARRKRSGYSGY